MRLCFFCQHPQASLETGTLLQSRQPLAAPQLAPSLAQPCSLTSHPPCLLLQLRVFGMDPGSGTRLWEESLSSLWTEDTPGDKPSQQLWENRPQRRGQTQIPPALECPHPIQQPHTRLRSQLFPPTGLIKSIFRARAVTGTWPPAWHGSAFIQIISQLVTKA